MFVIRVRYGLLETVKKLAICPIIVRESSKAVRRCTVNDVSILPKKHRFGKQWPTKPSARRVATLHQIKLNLLQSPALAQRFALPAATHSQIPTKLFMHK